MTNGSTYLFAGGGTGGHLFPGIAVAEALRRRDATVRCVFMGSDRPIERRICEEQQVEHISLPLLPLRDLMRQPWRFVTESCRSFQQAARWVAEHRPRAVIGLGGLASLPAVWAARRRRFPIVLLEQNVIPGRSTRWLARWADRVCVTFAESQSHLPHNTQVVVTGNPLRVGVTSLRRTTTASTESSPMLLILGGSQGAEGLNRALLALVETQSSCLTGWDVVHQAGPRQTAELERAYRAAGVTADVVEFLTDLPRYYQRAELVITRAGATTLTELACVGRAMILVPYPHAADDHQQANADHFARHGAARIVRQGADPQMTAVALCDVLQSLLVGHNQRTALATAASKLGRPDAADAVANVVEALASS